MIITYIPARDWHSSAQKPKDGEEVLGVIGKGKHAYVDIVSYDSRDQSWIKASGFHLTEAKVTYWTELPNVPYPDTSRNEEVQ